VDFEATDKYRAVETRVVADGPDIDLAQVGSSGGGRRRYERIISAFAVRRFLPVSQIASVPG
jgi:hypothetical protein